MLVHAGLPRSGENQGKQKFFRVSEKSGKIFGPVKVNEKSGNYIFIAHKIPFKCRPTIVLKGSQEYFHVFYRVLQDNGSDHDRNRYPVDPSGPECTGRPTFHLHTSCQCIFLAANRSSISAFNPLDQSYRKGLYRTVPSRHCIGSN